MKGFETPRHPRDDFVTYARKKECPAMKGFETLVPPSRLQRATCKKECPAMKGFETPVST